MNLPQCVLTQAHLFSGSLGVLRVGKDEAEAAAFAILLLYDLVEERVGLLKDLFPGWLERVTCEDTEEVEEHRNVLIELASLFGGKSGVVCYFLDLLVQVLGPVVGRDLIGDLPCDPLGFLEGVSAWGW